MEEENKEEWSEDYRVLMQYKNDPTKEKLDHTRDFFIHKYQKMIKGYCKMFLRFCDDDPALRLHESRLFFLCAKDIYLPRSIKKFDPEKITDKNNYIFAKYMHYELKHLVRDLSRRLIKNRGKKAPVHSCILRTEEESAEEAALKHLEEENARRERNLILEKLSPLQKEIFYELEKGKKQNKIEILNPKTQKPYSPGYICKEVAVIRYWTKKITSQEN